MKNIVSQVCSNDDLKTQIDYLENKVRELHKEKAELLKWKIIHSTVAETNKRLIDLNHYLVREIGFLCEKVRKFETDNALLRQKIHSNSEPKKRNDYKDNL